MRFTYFSVFSGIGGFELALNQLGGQCVGYSEIDKFAIQTYEANFGHLEGYPQDIRNLTQLPPHDLLVGGFPCQDFSFAGHRKEFAGDRGKLFYELVRVLRLNRPKYFIFENVVMRKEVLAEIIQQLKASGYRVYNQILNSADFGVPQNRKRNYFVGIRSDLAQSYDFPTPSQHHPTIREILEVDVDPKYHLSDRYLTSLKAREDRHKQKDNGFSYAPLDLNGCSNTIHVGGASKETNLIKENNHIRRLTPRECARLQGFPDSFQFIVSDSQLYKQFGNAVTVTVVHAVAQILFIQEKKKISLLEYL